MMDIEGHMKMIVVAVVAVIAALAAAGFAWQSNRTLEHAKAELAIAASQLQKAKDDMLAARAETAALQKEFAEQKLAAERSQAELASIQSFLDSEKAAGARVREELMKAKEQLAFLSRPRPLQAVPVQAMPVSPAIQGLRIMRGPSGSAIGVGVPAR